MANKVEVGKRYRFSMLNTHEHPYSPGIGRYLGCWGECIEITDLAPMIRFDDGLGLYLNRHWLQSEEEYNEAIRLHKEVEDSMDTPQSNTDTDEEFKEAFKQPEPKLKDKAPLTGEDIAEIAISNSKTRQFETGSVRDDDSNKPLVNHIDPYLRLRVGYLFRAGANKYDKGNWKKGQPTETALESLHRHLAKYEKNLNDGVKQDEDHLAACLFNIQLIMKNEEKDGIAVDEYYGTLK